MNSGVIKISLRSFIKCVSQNFLTVRQIICDYESNTLRIIYKNVMFNIRKEFL
jgi:hypothetical protein